MTKDLRDLLDKMEWEGYLTLGYYGSESFEDMKIPDDLKKALTELFAWYEEVEDLVRKYDLR